MKARMTQQVEELQWRIKNKMELPPTKVCLTSGSTTATSADRPNTLLANVNGLRESWNGVGGKNNNHNGGSGFVNGEATNIAFRYGYMKLFWLFFVRVAFMHIHKL